MDEIMRLKLAVGAARYGNGHARLTGRARKIGTAAFVDVLNGLAGVDVDRVHEEAEGLLARGVSATLLGSAEYPSLLSAIRDAPPFIFYLGSPELLKAPGIGVCGSRNSSEASLRAAAACGEIAVQQNLTVISGYARGVDIATHVSALASGGRTVIVLPEGIDRFRVRRGAFAEVWDPKRVLVVSQFAPSRPWSAGGAMSRNSVIFGLALALVVVEARDKGGTLAAGTRALELNRPVIALECGNVPRGNTVLLQRGAVPVRDRAEFVSRLTQVASGSSGNQLSII